MNNYLGPRNKEEEMIFAGETFLVDMQEAIAEIMEKKNVSYEDLAQRLNLSQEEITLLFEEDFSVATLGRILFSLDGSHEEKE